MATAPLTFRAHCARLRFRALESLYFAPGKSGNVLRGAFGLIFRKIASPEDYQRIFEPTAGSTGGPSGLADWPRPFVFRAAHLDGRRLRRGEEFHFDLHLFDTRRPALDAFSAAFTELVREGIGPGRGRAELLETTSTTMTFPLSPTPQELEQVRVEFLTPTELKGGDGLLAKPDFGVLLARARDRVSMLAALYGDGPFDLDFRALGERAGHIRMTRCDVRHVDVERLSTRTGQRHPLGGFVGSAEYHGALSEFVPWLEAAAFTGVGRQTTWGKGELRVRATH